MQTENLKELFVQKINEHERLIYKICHIYSRDELDLQDLFQEIVIQLWKAYPSFKGKAKFSTWLYKVGINTAIAGLRKKKTITESFEPEKLQATIDDTLTYQQKEEQFSQLYAAIELLNEIEKAIVMLYLEDKSYQEMEEILGINEGNLRVKMNRIKEKLRQLTKNN